MVPGQKPESYDEDDILEVMIEILHDLPVKPTTEGLYEEVWARLSPDMRQGPRAIYSPAPRHQVGQRLYHPAPVLQRWFTVCEPISDDGFRAKFDNGDERRLRHGVGVLAARSYSSSPEAKWQRVLEKVLERALRRGYIVEQGKRLARGRALPLTAKAAAAKATRVKETRVGGAAIHPAPPVKKPAERQSPKPAPPDHDWLFGDPILPAVRRADLFDFGPLFADAAPTTPEELAHLLGQPANGDRIDELRALCRKYRLTRLHYVAPLANVPSILDLGILPRNFAPVIRASFADEEIQSKRHTRRPLRGILMTLHDFVPLFFAPRPPLLLARRGHQLGLVYLRVNPVVLLEPGAAFASVNAVSAEVFYTDIADLSRLDWGTLHSDFWGDNFDKEAHRQRKLNRQAEALIPFVVPVSKIVDIVVHNADALQNVTRELKQRELDIRVQVDRSLYYCD